MLYAVIDWEICKVCEDCSARLICNTRAVMKFDADEPAVINIAQCNGCAKCLAACPFSAISLVSPASPPLSAN